MNLMRWKVEKIDATCIKSIAYTDGRDMNWNQFFPLQIQWSGFNGMGNMNFSFMQGHSLHLLNSFFLSLYLFCCRCAQVETNSNHLFIWTSNGFYIHILHRNAVKCLANKCYCLNKETATKCRNNAHRDACFFYLTTNAESSILKAQIFLEMRIKFSASEK